MTEIKTPTKTDLLKTLLLRESGATLQDICDVTGWQAHSARAALTGLRKSGIVVDRRAGEGEAATTWRIVPATKLVDTPAATSE